MANDKVTIKIPRRLYESIQEITARSGFSSPTELIVFVLRSLVSDSPKNGKGDEWTEEGVQAIRERLKGLGYLKE
jgi:metal-responsive CopG/Arc/MetJ family transcriptional regulator